MNGGGGLFGPGIPLDRVSPGMVIDVASLILQVNSLTILDMILHVFTQILSTLLPTGLPCCASEAENAP